MHPSVFAKRRAEAMGRIDERAGALVEQLELDPALAAALQPVGIREPLAAELARLEALADLMDKIADRAGVPPPPVPDTTVNKFIAPPAQPEPEQEPNQVELSGVDGLPAPTLEEEIPIEDEPAQDVIEGKLPALEDEPPAKKTTSRSSKSSTKKRS